EDIPELDAIITPVGGGGLLSGTALTAHFTRSSLQVFGAEPQGADDAYRSFTTGTLVREQTPQTICDGLRTLLSERTFRILREHVTAIGTASEARILEAMRMMWNLLKIIVEPSCCPPLAAILEGNLPVTGKRVGIILTGGNVDLDQLPWYP
ncbi:MAG TPA: pyridoxal-phosphate dependent enzyme, partial [Gemmatales bacterium]|nr:pyridoxal-phosphate dependent enzyme [Gemmatales bacterium]